MPKQRIPMRSKRKYLDPVFFLGEGGVVHFINRAGLQVKEHPTKIKLFEVKSGKIIVEDEYGTIIGSFFGKNWEGGKK